MQESASFSHATNLSDEQAAALEKELEQQPDDVESRIQLLKKYHLGSDAQRTLRLKHILWIIEYQPQHAIAGTAYTGFLRADEHFQQGKALWLRQLETHKDNVAILSHAARFFVMHEEKLAERCLLKAVELEPANADLKSQLAHFYSLWGGKAAQILTEQNQETGDFAQKEVHFHHLSRMPVVAFEAGKFDKAKDAAEELLKLAEGHRDSSHYINAINGAHTILGRVALQAGDAAGAIAHLKQSAHANLSASCGQPPELNLDLARDLLNAGEQESVLAYLDQHEQQCGYGNEAAFELRYESEHGKLDRDNQEAFKAFLEAFFARQLNALKVLDSATRRQHLESLLEVQRHSFDLLSEEIETEKGMSHVNHERIALLEHQLELCKTHLQQLESLAT